MCKIKLKRVFGLVGMSETDELILTRSLIPLPPVLHAIENRRTDNFLYTEYKGIKPEEIKAARAYACRFGANTDNPAALPEGQKSLLLDENISYTLLPLVTNLFGVSTHVEAEGLSRQNLSAPIPARHLDLKICNFAIKQQFTGIVTCDTDFAHMYKHADHPVRNLHVFLMQPSKNVEAFEHLLKSNAGVINSTLSQAPKLTNLS